MNEGRSSKKKTAALAGEMSWPQPTLPFVDDKIRFVLLKKSKS